MTMLSEAMDPSLPPSAQRQRMVIGTAQAAGLFDGASNRIGGRVKAPLLAAAKARSGISSDTELIEYALAKVALEDDFGPRLVARKGSVTVELEF